MAELKRNWYFLLMFVPTIAWGTIAVLGGPTDLIVMLAIIGIFMKVIYLIGYRDIEGRPRHLARR